jgi:hypothetical protein
VPSSGADWRDPARDFAYRSHRFPEGDSRVELRDEFGGLYEDAVHMACLQEGLLPSLNHRHNYSASSSVSIARASQTAS